MPGRVVRAVDTTGAGDCFVGALAAQAGRRRRRCARPSSFANAAAWISVQRMGAGPSIFPTAAEVAAVLWEAESRYRPACGRGRICRFNPGEVRPVQLSPSRETLHPDPLPVSGGGGKGSRQHKLQIKALICRLLRRERCDPSPSNQRPNMGSPAPIDGPDAEQLCRPCSRTPKTPSWRDRRATRRES